MIEAVGFSIDISRDVNPVKVQRSLMHNIPVVNNWTSQEHQGC